ncbi:hypothetical protein JCM31271_35390 [Halorubrum trueperi]
MGVAVGGTIAVAIAAFGRGSRRELDAASLLGTLSVLSIVALPLLRSYRYYGGGDSLTHLGWAREMRAGVIDPDAVLYPGIHTASASLSAVSGIELTHALLLFPLFFFPLVFVLGSTRFVSALSNSASARGIGTMAALCFVPINKVSVHALAHPSSQAILFLPVLLFLLIRYQRTDGTAFPLFDPFGSAFALGCLGLIVIHPQEAMTLLSMLAAMAVVGTIARRYRPTGELASGRSLSVHTILLGVVLAIWVARYDRARDRVAYVIESLLLQTHEPLSETAARGSTLGLLGGSFEELFAKLFAVTLAFCLLAAGLFLASSIRVARSTSDDRDAVVSALAVGLAPPTLGALVIFAADQGDHYFRFLGTIMVPVTLVGTLALVGVVDRLEARARRSGLGVTRTHLRVALVVVLVGFLALQAVAVHQSPYVYKSSQQVTGGELDGFETVFVFHDEETPLLGFRSGSGRYADAHYGSHTAQNDPDFSGYRDAIPGEVFSESLTTHYDSDRYLVLLEGYERIEVDLYQEVRYTREGYRTVETSPAVDRIQDNGELELYRISPPTS